MTATVRELIEALSEFEDSAAVYIHSSDALRWCSIDVKTDIYEDTDGNIVIDAYD